MTTRPFSKNLLWCRFGWAKCTFDKGNIKTSQSVCSIDEDDDDEDDDDDDDDAVVDHDDDDSVDADEDDRHDDKQSFFNIVDPSHPHNVSSG